MTARVGKPPEVEAAGAGWGLWGQALLAGGGGGLFARAGRWARRHRSGSMRSGALCWRR